MIYPLASDWAWLIAPLAIFGRYAVLSGIAFLLFYIWRKRAWIHRKIQRSFPQSHDYRREVAYSFLTAFIFASVGLLCLKTPFRAYTLWYTDVSVYGTGYLLLSIVLIVLLHDTYFYWIHRLMHHPAFYRRVHLLHHRSVNPSPWAAYAFHPLEAVLEAGIVPLMLLIMPVHPIAFFSFVTIMLWFNIYGHLGYELFPSWVYRHPLGRWINSSVYHNLHHERFHGNYGLYFTFWDRWMGTFRQDNDDRIADLHSRIAHHA
ncbi:MAG: sterol desaturase family protein [Saprospiraceae bacterium]|nr:sterol desaturase family protein [Saprospiraceae bacterium]